MKPTGKNNKTSPSGLLLINKQAGPSSHDVVMHIRRISGIKKIGHAGTLDPLAQGVLVILIGREATKKQQKFLNKDKEYIAIIYLGIETDSYDKTGRIMKRHHGALPSQEEIKKVLKKFEGNQLQVPPTFSAKKIQGKKAYQLARQGKKVKLKPQKITIFHLSLLDYQKPQLKLKIVCSAGTYIRSLANDLGKALGCGAHLSELTRTKSGDLSLKDAVELKNLNRRNWQKQIKPIERETELT